ncbi:MAG: hypothetical protein P8163_04195 [Candidatus Thiodiazotropha sp.]
MKLTLKYYPYALLIILCLILLGANPFNGETVAPTDLLVNQSGWRNSDIDVKTIHPIRSDILDARLPRWIQAKHSIRRGEIPIWNPYPINGIPGIQWLPAAILTPSFAMFAIIEDDATGYYFSMLINLLIAALGSYLLLYTFTKNTYAALFGSIVFCFSGFHSAWFFWAHVTTSIWIPWVLLFTYQYLTTQQLKYLPRLSLVIALLIFGGFPSIVVYTFIATTMLVIAHLQWGNGVRSVASNSFSLIGFSILGFLIPIFAIYSLYEMLEFTQASTWRSGGTPLNVNHLQKFITPIGHKYGDVERTFYVGLIPLALSLLVIPLAFFKKLTKNMLLGIVLLILTTTLAFGIIPQDFVRTLPTFNNNNWGRITILIALAFSIISAEILAAIFKSKTTRKFPPSLVFLVAISLVLVQFFDTKRLFNDFNGAVPAETFFPTTPTITYVKENLAPLQSVIADRSYLISGVLANYGISEWFAHGFRTLNEINLLRSEVAIEPFSSPTSAILECGTISMQSNAITLLGIRYIICSKILIDGKLKELVARTSGEKSTPSKLITQATPITQYFSAGADVSTDIISIRIATYRRKTSHADLILSIYNQNTLLGRARVAAHTIGDNDWVDFVFPERINLSGSGNRMVLEAESVEQNGKLSAWLYPVDEGPTYLEQAGKRQNLVLAAKIFRSQTPQDLKYKYYNLEPGIDILENKNVQGSGYFLARLDKTAKPDFKPVTLKKYTLTNLEFDYTGNESGWVILPLRFYPGWKAYVNNSPVQTQSFLGMMPAIPVESEDQISYRYQPKLLFYLAFLSLTALIITIILAFSLRNR